MFGAILAIFREQLQTLKLRRMRGHAVVCGLGTRGTLLAQAFTERGGVAAIDRNPEAEGVEECRDRGVAVLIGETLGERLARASRSWSLPGAGSSGE